MHTLTHATRRKLKSTAILCCYYNPCGYKVPHNNYQTFAAMCAAAGVDLYCIELAYDDDPFVIDGAVQVRGERACSLVWQKERLLNMLITHVPDKYDVLGWFDADIVLLNEDWEAAIYEGLLRFEVCQPFIHTHTVKPDGMLTMQRESAAWCFRHRRKVAHDFANTHPGFAWAARAPWLRKVGLFDHNITGGGDVVMAASIMGSPLWMRDELSPAYLASMEAYCTALKAAGVCGSLGYATGTCLHLYHGSSTHRQYNQRYYKLLEYEYNPYSDIEVLPNGLLGWTATAIKEKPELVQWVYDYFYQRDEDG